jgi:hypothetical protein
MMPCADEIAAQVGQDKTKKDATEVYDAAYGTYAAHEHPEPEKGASTKLPHDPKPFTTK